MRDQQPPAIVAGAGYLKLGAFESPTVRMVLDHARPPIGVEAVQVYRFVPAALDGDAGDHE